MSGVLARCQLAATGVAWWVRYSLAGLSAFLGCDGDFAGTLGNLTDSRCVMPIDTAWIDARIARTKTMIVDIENAIDALAVQGMASYRLDTGQTAQTVTKLDLGSLRLELNQMDNRLATLCARRDGAAFNSRML